MSTIKHGKTRVQIHDINGKRTHVWRLNQVKRAKDATDRNGMIRQQGITRDADELVSEVYDSDGKRVARYLPGLPDVEAGLRYVEVHLARQNIWVPKAKSNHDAPILDRERGVYEYWLLGYRCHSKEEWEAGKRTPPRAFIDEREWKILHGLPRDIEMPEQERFADTGLPEA